MARSRWLHSLSINMVGTIVTAMVAFAALIVVARNLEPTLFGQLSIGIVIFNGIATLDGIRPVIIYRWAPHAAPERVARSAMVLMAGLAVIVAAIFAGGWALAPAGVGAIAVVTLGAACALYFPMSALVGFLDAQKDTIFTGLIRNIGWSLTYASFALLSLWHARIDTYMAALLGFQLFLVLALLLRLARKSPRWLAASRFDAGVLVTILKDSLNLVGFNIAALVLGVTDRIALALGPGMATVGAYSAVSDLATRPTALMRVAANVSLPELKDRTGNGQALYRQWRVALFAAFAGAALGILPLIFWRDQVVAFLLSAKYLPAANAFGIVLISIPFFIVGYFCAMALQAHGDFRSQRRIYTLGAISVVAAAYPLVAWRPLEGAALLCLLSRWVDVALLLTTYRDLALPYFRLPHLTLFAAVAVGAALAFQESLLSLALGLTLVAVAAAWLGTHIWRAITAA